MCNDNDGMGWDEMRCGGDTEMLNGKEENLLERSDCNRNNLNY